MSFSFTIRVVRLFGVNVRVIFSSFLFWVIIAVCVVVKHRLHLLYFPCGSLDIIKLLYLLYFVKSDDIVENPETAY